jgi:acylphosphatase
MISKQIIVTGRVQGVGFRNYTQRKATQLGVVGWARNLYTSQVEIFAQANDEKILEKFLLEIKKGPLLSKVENIEIIDVDSNSATCDTFRIESDGEKKRDF